MKIAVWFSCGAASAVAAKKTVEIFGKDHEVIVLNSGIKEEDSDNRRFLKDVEKWIGQEIQIVHNPKYPLCSAVEVWEDRQYMSDIHGAPCTGVLKKEPRIIWSKQNKPDFHVLGFTFNEIHRHKKFVLTETPFVLPVLIAHGITKRDCFDIIQSAGIELPVIYKLGYPNANCIGCVKATSPTYWNHVRKMHPEIFDQRAKQSRRVGAKLVRYKGNRIYLDELPEDAKGAPMKNMDFECGVFCEEKT